MQDEFKARVSQFLASWLDGLTQETRAAYLYSVTLYSRHRGEVSPESALADLVQFSKQEAASKILAWKAGLIREGKAAATINLRLSAITSCLNAAEAAGLVPWILRIPKLRAESYRDTRGPGEVTYRAALQKLTAQALEAGPGQIKDRRDFLLIRLLHDCGLRVREAVTLDLAHIDPKDGIWIKGKGRSEREMISLPTATKNALDRWLEVRGMAPGPLFIALTKSGRSPKATRRRITTRHVRRITKALGLGHPHGLRHLAITTALDRTNGDFRRVMKFSRHRNVNVVLRYDDNRLDVAGEIAQLVAAE